MKNFLMGGVALVSFGLVSCSPEPAPVIPRNDVQDLVARVAENSLDGSAGFLVDPNGIWLGDTTFVREHGDSLPSHLASKQLYLKANRSPDLHGVDLIRDFAAQLGLDWSIDTGSFYLVGESVGSSGTGPTDGFAFPGGAGVSPNFLPPVQGGAPGLNFGAPQGGLGGLGDPGGSGGEVSRDASGGSCDGEPIRVVLPNEGLEELEKFGTKAEVARAVLSPEPKSAGEVALNSVYSRGLKNDVEISGRTEDALDQLVAALGLGTWEYRDNPAGTGKIIFRYYVTRTFQAPILAASGQDASGWRNRLWTKMRTGLARNLGSSGEVATWCDQGEVRVTARPENMGSISDWIDGFTQKNTRAVHVEVDVYEIDSSSSDGFTLDWNLLSKSYTAGGDIPRVSVFGPSGDSNSLLGVFEDVAEDAVPDFDSILPSSPTGGISLVADGDDLLGTFTADLLATAGDSTLAYSTGSSIFDGQRAPVNFTTETTARIGSASTTNEDGQETGTADILRDYTVGYQMDVEARILRGNRILLYYSLNVSSGEPGGPDDIIQFQTSTSELSNQVIMRAGQELVQSVYQISTVDSDRSGVGDSRFPWLGGSDTASETLTTFVIVLRTSVIRPVL